MCMQATPSSETAMFYFQTNHLDFQPEFLGRVRLVAAIASVAGVSQPVLPVLCVLPERQGFLLCCSHCTPHPHQFSFCNATHPESSAPTRITPDPDNYV